MRGPASVYSGLSAAILATLAVACAPSAVGVSDDDGCDPSTYPFHSALPDTVRPSPTIAPARPDTLVRPFISGALLNRSDTAGSPIDRLDLYAVSRDFAWRQNYRLRASVWTSSGDVETLDLASEVCSWEGLIVFCNVFTIVWDEGAGLNDATDELDAIGARVRWSNRRAAAVEVQGLDLWSSLYYARGWAGVCTTGPTGRGQFFAHSLEFLVPFTRATPVPNDGVLQIMWGSGSSAGDEVFLEYEQPDGTVLRHSIGG